MSLPPPLVCTCDQFPYADAVVKEALRLHAPVGSTIRLATEELQVLGKTIPK